MKSRKISKQVPVVNSKLVGVCKEEALFPTLERNCVPGPTLSYLSANESTEAAGALSMGRAGRAPVPPPCWPSGQDTRFPYQHRVQSKSYMNYKQKQRAVMMTAPCYQGRVEPTALCLLCLSFRPRGAGSEGDLQG